MARTAPDEDEIERGPCGECDELISLEATVCPHCGYNPRKNLLGFGLVGPFLFLIVGVVASAFFFPLLYLFILIAVLCLAALPKAYYARPASEE